MCDSIANAPPQTSVPQISGSVSTGNSTVSTLGAGGVFNGTIEDVSNYAALCVSFYVSPPSATGNIFCQFSESNSPFYPVSNTATIVTPLTSNGFSIDLIVKGQYFRTVYINDSTPAQINIQTLYNTNARISAKTDRMTLPLTNYTDVINTRSIIYGQTQGNNPTMEVIGSNGNQSINVCINDPRTAFNEVSVAPNRALAQIDFAYGIATTVTSSNVTGNTAISCSSGLMSITCNNSAATQTSGIFSAKKFVKYRAGQGSQIRFTSLYSQPKHDCFQLSGAGFAVSNTTYLIDFIGFGYGNPTNTNDFGILWRNNGLDTWFPQSQWNYDTLLGGTKSGYTLVPSSLNSYQIQFQYCANILFSVENPYTGRYVLVHSIPSNLIAPTKPNFQNPSLNALWYANCTTSNTVSIYGGSVGHFLEGDRFFTGPRGSLYNAPLSNLAINTETMILALQNSTYYGANSNLVIPNRSQIHLRALTASSAGVFSTTDKQTGTTYYSPAAAIVVFKQIRFPNNGPIKWTPYSGGVNIIGEDGTSIYGVSSISSNTTPLTNLTGGNTGFTWTLPVGASTSIIDLEPYESVLYPGDIICWTANVISQFNTSNVCVAMSLTWNEDI